MRTNKRNKELDENRGFKARFIRSGAICVLLIISVMCIKSVNNDSPLIKSIRHSLNTSVNYGETVESIKNIFSKLLDEGEPSNEKQQSVPTDSVGQTL